MDFFNGWVQGIVIAVIITILIEMILPEGNNKKYIKIVLGIYVVFSIISPVIGKVTGGNFEVSSIINMDKYAKELGTYEEMVKERKIENSNEQNIRKIYIEKLKEDITTKLRNKGYTTKKIELNVEEDESYTIKDIILYIDKNKQEEERNKDSKSINNINEVQINKIVIGNEKENENEIEQSDTTFFERKEITKYISETYGLEENKIKVN